MFLKLAFAFIHCLMLHCFALFSHTKEKKCSWTADMNEWYKISYFCLSLGEWPTWHNITYLPNFKYMYNKYIIENKLQYPELGRGSSLVRQRTKDLSKTDFSMILHKRTAVTQHGMAYLCKWPHAWNKTNTSTVLLSNIIVSLWTSVSSYISLSVVSNAHKCLLQTQTNSVYLCTSKKINNSMFIL